MSNELDFDDATNFVYVDWDGVGRCYGDFRVYDALGDMAPREFHHDDANDRVWSGESFQKAKTRAFNYAKQCAAKMRCDWGDNLPSF